jgi:hypothetical protein
MDEEVRILLYRSADILVCFGIALTNGRTMSPLRIANRWSVK